MRRVSWMCAVGFMLLACSDDDAATPEVDAPDTDVAVDATGETLAETAAPDATSTPETATEVATETSASDGTGEDGLAETSADVDTPETGDVTSGSCTGRVCGPDPLTHESCGICSEAGKLACNDGRCEATCDAGACAAMSYSENTCVSSGECDGSPDGHALTASFACAADGTRCEGDVSAVDCGLFITDCMPCDLAGSDDGLCENDVCKAADATQCVAAGCAGRECGPDPLTHESCGTCATDGLFACNDGRCEAVCDDGACGAMSYSINTCVSAGECDGSPEGFIAEVSYACSADGARCEDSASGVDCGLFVTECMPCDLAGTDDGFCHDDVCVAPADVTCQ